MISGSVVAGISTIAVFLPFYTQAFSIAYRLLIAMLVTYISFGFQEIRKLIIRAMTYIGISMLLCASVIIVELIWNPTGCAVYNDTIYFNVSPAILIITTLLTYIILSIYQKISQKHKLTCAVKTVEICINTEHKLTFESAVDTGCNLKEPFSGLPVIMLEREIIGEIQLPDNNMRIIPYSTAAGSDIIMGFKPQQVRIDGKELYKGCYVGICHNKLLGEIKSIMGTEISEAV